MCNIVNELYLITYLITHFDKIIDTSISFTNLTGYTANEILNKTLPEVWEQLLRATQSIANIESGLFDSTCFIFTKDYEVREVSVSIRQDYNTKHKTFYIHEISDSRICEKMIYINQLYIENISSIAIFSSDLILLYANEKYLGLYIEPYDKPENSIGRPFSDIFEGFTGSNFERKLKNLINGGPIFRSKEFKFNKYDAGKTYWDSTIVPIYENNRVKYIIENTNDVTERVLNRNSVNIQSKTIKLQKNQLEKFQNILRETNKQQLLLEKAKNEALEKTIKMKDEFLSLISHEFKTPLTVIYAAIQAMELICKDELSQKAKNFIAKIRQNSFRQLRLVNNLLDITRTKADHIKVTKKNLDIVFLTKSITESVYLYSHQKEIKITFVSTFGQKIIGIDDEKYERILLNLLSNSIKFTPKGKCITVILSLKKGLLCVEVKDSGIGIPEEKISLIFERFEQVDSSMSRQAEGTGIGLSLVKLFVDALDGDISVKSKVGKGSTFTILLPATKVADTEQEKFQITSDNRLIHATAIEFSDIYL